MQGLKMGSIVGNDQNTLLYDFMQKLKDRNSNVCSWSTVVNCRVIHRKFAKVSEIERKFKRVFLGPKWGYDRCLGSTFQVWEED